MKEGIYASLDSNTLASNKMPSDNMLTEFVLYCLLYQ